MFASFAGINMSITMSTGASDGVWAGADLDGRNMPVSLTNSKLIFDALKECDIRMVSALPETWLVHLNPIGG